MKRFLCIILCIAGLLQSVAVAAKDAESDDSIERLTYLGMLSAELYGSLSKPVTKEDFAGILLSLMKENETAEASKSYFYDVGYDNPNAGQINKAAELGYIGIAEDKMYHPKENIKFREVGDAILRTMGYGKILEDAATLTESVYHKLLDGVDSSKEFVTVQDIAKMFDNALDEDAIDVKIDSNGVSFKADGTFLEKKFRIRTVRGRVTATSLTSLDSSVKCSENEVAIDNVTYNISDNIQNIREYLGYWVKAYYSSEKGDNTVIYFKTEKTESLVISAKNIVSYSDNVITYQTENGDKIKTARFKKGAYIIFNGIMLENYSKSVFEINNGSIELVGSGSNYDVVKIYNYKDVLVSGVTDEKIFIKDSDETWRPNDYDAVIIRDPYGRNMEYSDITENSVISIGASEDKSLLILNVNNKVVEGVYQSQTVKDGKSIWVVDDREYTVSLNAQLPTAELKSKVKLYFNYLNEIAFAEATQSFDWRYGYLVKAYTVDGGDDIEMKVFTQNGEFIDYMLVTKCRIDGDVFFSPDEALTALSYASPGDLNPQPKVQPQLIKYRVNAAGKVTKIDTARNGSEERDKTSLKQNLVSEERLYRSDTGRLFGMFADETMDCMLGDDTIVFTVPGNEEEARTQLSAYSVGGKSAIKHEEQITISSFDTDYENGAIPKVVCVLLDSILAEPDYLFSKMVVVTEKNKVWSEQQECEVSSVKGYEYYTNQRVTLESVWEKDVFADVEPGDMIRYGYVNNRITKIKKDFDLSDFTYKAIHEGEGGNNWSGDHIFAMYCIVPAKLVDIINGYMFMDFRPTKNTTAEGCKLIYNTKDMKVFIFNKNTNKMYESDVNEMRNYLYRIDQRADVVVYTSYCVPKMAVIYI